MNPGALLNRRPEGAQRLSLVRLAAGVALLVAFLLGTSETLAADTGFENPSATGDDYSQWSNPANAYFSDNVRATESSNGRQQDWYNFSFSIPVGATIDGIELVVEFRANSGTVGADVELSWNGGGGVSFPIRKTSHR